MDYFKGLETWKAAAIISASVISVAGVGYIIYRYLDLNSNSATSEKEAKQKHPAKSGKNKKKEHVEIIQEVMVEVLNYINNFNNDEEHKYTAKEIPEKIYEIASSITQRICRQRGLSERGYDALMKSYRSSKDKDISKQANVMDILLKDIQEGEKPREVLSCNPKCTKKLTINIYRWIALIDIYVDYREVLKNLAGTGVINKKQFEELKKANTAKKLDKRAVVLERKIKAEGYGQNDYFNLVKKPYCKYRLEDKNFNDDAKELQKLCDKLQEFICNKLAIPEFKNDPCNLSFEEVPKFYSEMYSKYINIESSGLLPMSEISEDLSNNGINDSPRKGIAFGDAESFVVEKSAKRGEDAKGSSAVKGNSHRREEEKLKQLRMEEAALDENQFKEFQSSEEESGREVDDYDKNKEGKDNRKKESTASLSSPQRAEELIGGNDESLGPSETSFEREIESLKSEKEESDTKSTTPKKA